MSGGSRVTNPELLPELLNELRVLENNISIIAKYKFIDGYKIVNDDKYFLKLKVTLVDGSVLNITEFVSKSKSEYKYSFHWQKENGELIIRWDNAPHHKNIKTYPHHKHVGSEENIRPSKEIFLKDILRVIEKEINDEEN